jgi:hypothetical protein
VNDDSKTAKGTSSFHTRNKVIPQCQFFLRDTQNEFSRLDNEGISIIHGNNTHILRKCFRTFRIQHGIATVLIHLKGISQTKIHTGSMNVPEELWLTGFYGNPPGFNGSLNVAVRKDHGGMVA